ncbi:hypothetical protein GE061_004556 [Apolygus lucorum]|uniref:Uncharacterized protein n=1 Tax=Apolygus lucorum TaxID=248454 RepID=A0A6A4IPP6_APOLU|nr:hypothetical protein GE061_004556 [Apolygus lucorum]
MDDSGPEGLGYHEILQIPKVTISLDQLKERSLQCSVCLEELQVNEVAKKLPCEHYYHERCIVPWLELRSTCPDCRRNLVPESHDSDTEDGYIDHTYVDEDEETLSGYESAHSNVVPSHVSVVSNVVRVVDSVNGHLYYDDIEDDFDFTVLVPTGFPVRSNQQPRHTSVVPGPRTPDTSRSPDTLRSPATSPITISDSEDEGFRYSMPPKRRWGDSSSPEASGSRDVTIDSGAVSTDPSLITVDYPSDDFSSDVSPVEIEFSLSENSSDTMAIESESLETISIASSSEFSMYGDY